MNTLTINRNYTILAKDLDKALPILKNSILPMVNATEIEITDSAKVAKGDDILVITLQIGKVIINHDSKVTENKRNILDYQVRIAKDDKINRVDFMNLVWEKGMSWDKYDTRTYIFETKRFELPSWVALNTIIEF